MNGLPLELFSRAPRIPCCWAWLPLRRVARKQVRVVHRLTQGNPRSLTMFFCGLSPERQQALALGCASNCPVCGAPVITKESPAR